MDNTRFEQIDKEIENLITKLKKGQPTYSPVELQRFRDGITKLNREKAKLDHEARKDSIKIVKIPQPVGNSSAIASRGGQRYNVRPEDGAMGMGGKIEL